MKTESLGGFDRFRVPAALLVIAIHTGPLLSLNGEANYLLTDILARIAVPFFFSVSGWFLVPRLLREGRAALIPFVKKLLLLYGAAVLLYLPLNLYNHTLEESGFALLRDVLFNGTFYHLWYFPALVLGACLVYGLLRILGPRWAWLPALLLYAAGLLGDSYFGLTAALPPLRAGYEALFLLFDYTRNGLFFPPVFLLLGGWLALRPARRSAAWYGAGLLLSLALLTAEGLLVQRLALARFDALYLSLPLCVGFLLRWLQRLSLPSAPALRDWAAAVYVLHPWCIVLIRGGAGVVGLTGLLVDNCLVHYLAVVLLSSLLALPFARIRPAPSPRSRAWIELDAAALRHNLAALGSLLPAGASLMPVIKANAYGHGDLEIARLCVGAGADAFAVATAAEGVRLRRGGVRGTILVLGYSGPELAPLLARYRLTQTVVSTEHARALDACGRRLAVHLKVDTGLHRLGIPWDDTQSLTAPYSCSHLRVTGVFTHLADTERLDEASQARTREQLRRFRAAVDGLRSAGHAPGTVHFQGSYGLLNYPGLPCDCARPGIALYGVLSAPGDATTAALPLRPVLSLRARVSQLHTLAAGEAAGYDGAYTAHRPTVLATLSIGYADGWPRTLSNGAGRVLLHGRTAPIVGLICMDQLLVDVTDMEGVAPGDTATLIGRDGDAVLTAEEAAQAAGTITNELLSRLGPRLERVVLP